MDKISCNSTISISSHKEPHRNYKIITGLFLFFIILVLMYGNTVSAAEKIEIDDEEYNLYIDEYPDDISNGIFAKFNKAKNNTDDYYLNLTSEESAEKFEKALNASKITPDENQLTASFDSILFYTDPEGEKDDAKKTDAVTVLCPLPDEAQEHPDDCSVYLVSSGKAKPITPSVYVDDDEIYYVKLEFPTYGTYGFIYNDPSTYDDEEEPDDEEPDDEEPDDEEPDDEEPDDDEPDITEPDDPDGTDDGKAKDGKKSSDDKQGNNKKTDNGTKKQSNDEKKSTGKSGSTAKKEKSQTAGTTDEDEYDYDFGDSDEEYYYPDDEYLFDDDDDAASQQNKGVAKSTFPKNRDNATSTQDTFDNLWNNTPTDVTSFSGGPSSDAAAADEGTSASSYSEAADVSSSSKVKDSVPRTGDDFPLTQTAVTGGLAAFLLLLTFIKIKKH